MISIWTIVLLALLGVAVGSFVNVLTIRFNPEGRVLARKSVGGRSRCLSCKKALAWYELLPVVSFVVQLAKCRTCKNSLLWQYPVVEVISGLIFVFVPLQMRTIFALWSPSWSIAGFWLLSALWIIVFIALLVALLIDIKHYIIPNSLNALIFILGIIWIALAWRFGIFSDAIIGGGSFIKHYAGLFGDFSWISARILGLFSGTLFFLALVLLSRGKAMGVGDVKLMAGLGLLFGWPDVVLVAFLSFIIGAIVAVLLMMRRLKKMSDRVPFGPFIVVSAGLVFFFGTRLLDLYFGIIGM